jgi:ankyrin repeat protein
MDEQLIAAITSKNLSLVEKLLASGANPNACQGDTTAYKLVPHGNDQIKCALIEAGADDPELKYSLVWVIMTGRIKAVQKLIAQGADLNTKTFSGTPIHVAARGGHTVITELLIDAGADVDAGNSISTPLLNAIENGHIDIALKLIAAGADPNMCAGLGSTSPIAMAAVQGSSELIKAVIVAGAEINKIIPNITINKLAIHQEALGSLQGAFGAIESLGKMMQSLDGLDDDEVPDNQIVELQSELTKIESISTQQEERYIEPEQSVDTFPIIIAARCGHAEALEVLLENGADPHKKDGEGFSAHNWAVRNEFSDVLAKLAQFGVAETPLSLDEQLLIAAELGDIDILRNCLDQGADKNARDTRRQTRNKTALMIAAAAGYLEVVKTLLSANANPHLTDQGVDAEPFPKWLLEHTDANTILKMGHSFSRTALMNAAELGHTEIVKILLQSGCNPNDQDAAKYTALTLAAEKNHLNIVQILVAGGAEINQAAINGNTPLMLACENGSLEIVDFLLNHGADLAATNKDGDTAASLATLYGKQSIRLFLQEYTATDLSEFDPPEYDEDADDEEYGDDQELWGEDLPQPDFSSPAQNPAYQQAVNDLAGICSSKAISNEDIPGWFSIHVDSKRRKDIKTEELQKQFLERGCFVYEPTYSHTGYPETLCILPTIDKYEVIALHQTNGCNYGIGPGYVVQWLKDLEAEQPFILTCIDDDTLSGRFLTTFDEPELWAKRMYNFCSDIVDQGCGSVEVLAESLDISDNLFFWWD